MTRYDVSFLTELFSYLDRDNDGILSNSDLELALGALDISPSSFEKDLTGYDLELFLAYLSTPLAAISLQSSAVAHAFRNLHDSMNGPGISFSHTTESNSDPAAPRPIPIAELRSMLSGSLSIEDLDKFIEIATKIGAISPNLHAFDYEKFISFFQTLH